MPAKILLFDIETSLSKGYFFDLWKEGNIVEIESSWFMLSFAWKWLGQKKTHVYALPDFKSYSKDKTDDRELVTELHKLFDEADILVAHNGDKFDIRKANARFIALGLKPPSPYKTVDTLKIARKHFKFDSNRLDDLANYLGLGRKIPHTGKALWLGCMSGDPKCWEKMRRYNVRDVKLEEAVYFELRGWATTHPNLEVFTRSGGCPVCQSTNTKRSGFAHTGPGKKQRITCNACGHRFVSGKLIKEAA